ncbi:MAG: hypothetical protein ACOYVK_16195 [Bacillota bacterium]
MHPNSNNDSFIISEQNKQSFWGILSVVIGIFNIIISLIIIWALWSYINQKFVETLFLQVQILNIGSKLELVSKPIGFLLGIAGLFERNKKRTIALYGILINLIVILWTFAVFSGLII